MKNQNRERRSVTMGEIAESCDLSHATVSYVLRNRRSKPVSPATREKVFAAAVRMRYQPQRHQRLDASKLKVLLVCPEFDIAYGKASFPSRVFAELAKRSRETGIQFEMTATERKSIMETLFYGICENQADAVIITRVAPSEVAAVTADCPVPVLTLGHDLDQQIPSVVLADAEIGRMAAAHLWDQGHRSTMILGMQGGLFGNRIAGFREVWKQRSHGGLQPILWEGGVTEDAGLIHGERFLVEPDPKPSAVFAVTDSIAFGFMQAIGRAGRRIPDYVSLIACDDMPYSAWTQPPLTTFDLRPAPTAEAIIRLINAVCRGRAVDETQVSLVPELVVRESVRHLYPGNG